ncbi:YjbQ family protein [Patescibacteria group bacterium]
MTRTTAVIKVVIDSADRGITTAYGMKWIAITHRVQQAIRKAGFIDGDVRIQTLHTTAAIIVQEYEKCLLRDLAARLDKFAPLTGVYVHDDFTRRVANMCIGECQNGHSHGKRLLLPLSIDLMFANGKITRGRWQRVILAECDWQPDNPRKRTILIRLDGHFRS